MKPTVSIITIVYNGVSLLEGTIKSVLNQSYPNIEYVVVDGASKDGTVELLAQYKDQIDILVSEPDKGLYDAMNKGLQLATGDYVWFMNAGDWLYDIHTVERLMATKPNADVYYGKTMLVNDDRTELGLRSELTPHQLPTQLSWKNMNKGMVVCHQAFVPRRSLAPLYIAQNLCADIEWVIQVLKQANTIGYLDEPLATYLVGGISKQRHQQSLKDRYNILKKHFGFVPNVMNHGQIVIRAVYHKWVRRRGKAKY